MNCNRTVTIPLDEYQGLLDFKKLIESGSNKVFYDNKIYFLNPKQEEIDTLIKQFMEEKSKNFEQKVKDLERFYEMNKLTDEIYKPKTKSKPKPQSWWQKIFN